MNGSPPDRTLNVLAENVAEEFDAYRDPDGFNELSLVIDNSDRDRSTLIVHIDREQAADLADRVEAFLRNQGARTERERHADTDIRVLITIE
ncbi:MAG TPA: hypothetical protein VFJ06_12985 [Halococcus sp.]|nr:hypothetical protein [Halococcus sp.]